MPTIQIRQFTGHAIVHSKVLVIDPWSANPIAVAYATYVMSVYQHYRYRSYIREMQALKKKPWSYLDDNDHWLKTELKAKAAEIDYWT